MDYNVARTAKLVAPCHPSAFILAPFFSAPAVAFEAKRLLDEIPDPADCAVRFEGVDLRAQRGEIHPAVGSDGGAEDWLAAGNFLNHFSAVFIQHKIRPRHRPDVEEAPGDGRRRNVVAIGFIGSGVELPQNSERGRIDAESNSRAVNNIHAPVRNDRRSKDGIGQRDGANKTERRRHASVRHVARMTGIVFELEPILRSGRGRSQR